MRREPSEDRVFCPVIGGEVSITAERRDHMLARHPEMGALLGRVVETLADPDLVAPSQRDPQARLLSKWYTDPTGGKHLVVVVIDHYGPPRRAFVATAYMSSRVVPGSQPWKPRTI